MGTDKSTVRGVELRANTKSESIRIKFMYKGVECRETLQLTHSKANIRFAERLRGEILNAIEMGTFSYAKYFPESPQLKKLGLHSGDKDITIGQLLKLQFDIYERTLAPSTLKMYKRTRDYQLLPKWEHTKARELRAAEIRAWIVGFTNNARVIRQMLIPLRGALELAITDDIIEANPLDRVKLRKILSRDAYDYDFETDPFTSAEIQAILDSCDGQLRNVYQFAFCTGMRPSEYIALRWPAVSMQEFKVSVERARAAGVTLERTKTKAGRRLIDLRRGAHDALLAQMQHTFLAGDLVFNDPATRSGWNNADRVSEAWRKLLKRAKVRHRNLYQTRHTFASTLLSAGENLFYVAKQMGHRDSTMVIRTYGRWVEQDRETLHPMYEKMSGSKLRKTG